MEVESNLNEVVYCIKVAACICGKDGIISEAEEEKIFDIVNESFPTFIISDFDVALDEFFDSDDQIEDYLEKITDPLKRKFTLKLSELSASVDGLDIRENIALQKVYTIWGITPNE